MIVMHNVIIAARFLLELAALGALGYWGYQTGAGIPLKLLLGIGAPLAAAIVWGTFISPQASVPVAVPIRVLLELGVFVSAAAGLFAADRETLAIAFLTAALIDTALLYAFQL